MIIKFVKDAPRGLQWQRSVGQTLQGSFRRKKQAERAPLFTGEPAKKGNTNANSRNVDQAG